MTLRFVAAIGVLALAVAGCESSSDASSTTTTTVPSASSSTSTIDTTLHGRPDHDIVDAGNNHDHLSDHHHDRDDHHDSCGWTGAADG